MPIILILSTLYDVAEVVSEEAILRWIEKREKTDPTSAKGILFNLPVVKAFVEWIQQENDDDEEDDDDDDEDEE